MVKTKVKNNIKTKSTTTKKANTSLDKSIITHANTSIKVMNANDGIALSNKTLLILFESLEVECAKLCKEASSKLDANNLRVLKGTGIEMVVGKGRDSDGSVYLDVKCIYTHGYYKDLVDTSLFKKFRGEKINKTSRASAELRTNAKILLGVFYNSMFDRDFTNYKYKREMVIEDGKVMYRIYHKIGLQDEFTINELIKLVEQLQH